MRILSVGLRTFRRASIIITSEEDWVVSVKMNERDLGCVICPQSARRTWKAPDVDSGAWIERIIACIKGGAILEDEEVDWLRKELPALLEHLS